MGILDQLKRKVPVPDVVANVQSQPLDPLEKEGISKLKNYKVTKVLGRGASAEVKLALFNPTNTPVALKCINKANLPGFSGARARGKVLREMTILNHRRHPNVIQVYDTFQDEKFFYLALELATGGPLLGGLNSGRMPETRAASIIYQLLDGVAYLHEHNIVHRDLKPENIMYKDQNEDSSVVIMDFGVADVVKGEDLLHSAVVGTPRFSAPEVLHLQGHGKPSDIWSIGCVAYTLLCGFNPFRDAIDIKQMKELAIQGPRFPQKFWSDISPAAIDLVKRCMTVSPNARITAKHAKMHPWFVQHVPEAREYARAALEALDQSRANMSQKMLSTPRVNIPNLVEDVETLLDRQSPPMKA